MTRAMSLSFDSLLEMLAEKLATKLAREPSHLYPRLMTFEQTSAYIGITQESLQHWTASGRLPVVRIDHNVFLDRLDLDRWIDDHKTGWV